MTWTDFKIALSYLKTNYKHYYDTALDWACKNRKVDEDESIEEYSDGDIRLSTLSTEGISNTDK